VQRDAYTIIKKPRVTEKTTANAQNHNAYTFEVERTANKIEIRQAIEKLFKVKVDKVRTVNVKGKPKRVRFKWGKTPDWKKAIVTLKEGHKLDII